MVLKQVTVWAVVVVSMVSLLSLGACGGDDTRRGDPTGGDASGGPVTPVCDVGASAGEVQEPVFWMNLSGQTSWFADPVVYDLDGDGTNELIAAYYSVTVFDHQGNRLAEMDGGDGRVYAPHVVTDLEGDGITEIVYGNGHEVYCYEWRDGAPVLRDGWPVSTTTAGNSPEVRGMSAGDLNGDGSIEIVVSTTQTADEEDGGSQIFVFNADGSLYQPEGISWNAWPRYNAASGEGNDADRNGYGHHGFGCYGLNVGVGNIDDDPDLEILATYDNHHIQAFKHDGVAIDAADWFTNRDSEYAGERFTWGQFIRWADPQVEQDHYHDHTGDWPHPDWTEWLQWTASPPNVVDLDGDGKNEVLGVPNVEMHVPYETQAYALMVLEGAHGDGSRSAMRKAGWETLPRGDSIIQVDGWYPPGGVPAPTTADLDGDGLPEVIVSMNDHHVYCFDGEANLRWRYDYSNGRDILYASETIVADLNQDGVPELLLATFGDPDVDDSGHLVILDAAGGLLWDVPLPDPGYNGNGNGAPAAPSVGDLDGDGELEVFVQTFEHGLDVFKIPGSADNCLLWPNGRGGPLRMGQPNAN